VSFNPHNVMRADDVARITNHQIRYLVNPNSPINKYCYIGDGMFDRTGVEEFMYEKEQEEWFKAEVGNFVEYLNKIVGVSYSEMARKIGTTAISTITALRMTQKMSAKILVKYRAYLYEYDKYYSKETKCICL